MSELYVPSKDTFKFINFLKGAGIEQFASAEIHYKQADIYFSKHKRAALQVFRGAGKSTLLEWLILYTAALGYLPNFGPVRFLMFCGDREDNGVKNFFRNMSSKIETSAFLGELIKIKRVINNEMELVNLKGVQMNIKGYGLATGIRGVRYNNARPDICVLDDVTPDDAAKSEAVRKEVESNFYRKIVPALEPKHRMFFVGTPICEGDLLDQFSKNKRWTFYSHPIAEKFPCKKEEFRGGWESKFPYEEVEDVYESMKESGKSQVFYQEYMLERVDKDNLLVESEDLKWYDLDLIRNRRQLYNFYIATDFATSSKKSADFSTLGVFAFSHDQKWYLVDGYCKKQNLEDNINDLFKYSYKWKPLSVGIETSGQQGGYISIIEQRQLERNIFFNLASKRNSKEVGIRPVSDKLSRFITGVQPRFNSHKIWLPKLDYIEKTEPDLAALVKELITELDKLTLSGGVGKLAHDDAIDLLNQLSEMDTFYPSDTSSHIIETSVNEHGEIWEVFGKESSFENTNKSTVF